MHDVLDFVKFLVEGMWITLKRNPALKIKTIIFSNYIHTKNSEDRKKRNKNNSALLSIAFLSA
jgi:hypothetical protein